MLHVSKQNDETETESIKPLRNLMISCFGLKPHKASNGVKATANSGL